VDATSTTFSTFTYHYHSGWWGWGSGYMQGQQGWDHTRGLYYRDRSMSGWILREKREEKLSRQIHVPVMILTGTGDSND